MNALKVIWKRDKGFCMGIVVLLAFCLFVGTTLGVFFSNSVFKEKPYKSINK